MGAIITFFAMILLLFLKGFFSGSEIALVSADKIQMHHLARTGSRGARLLLRMFKRPDRLLTTTLVGTNLATVTLAATGTVLMIRAFGESGEFLAILIMTPLLLILGEVVPKSVYQQKAEILAPIIVFPLRGAYFLFFPIIYVFSQIARSATRLAGAGEAARSVFLTREQLRAVLEMTERRSDVAAFTRGRIRRAIRFGATAAAEVMIPLNEISLMSARSPIQQFIETVNNNGYRPVPIYEGNASNITGIASLDPWDIINDPSPDGTVESIMEPAYFAAPKQTLAELLPLLRSRRDQAAVIVDEYGSAIGVLTLESILRVVVGEIKVGYHFEKHPYVHKRTIQAVEDDLYILDAGLPISEVNDVIGLKLSTGEYHTVGGLLMARLQHIPREGEYIIDSGFRFTVQEATPRRPVKVRAEPEKQS
ncbi:MAG: hemolysin family protein [Syntrophales bacterium]|jgi:CBS domain containing-hemolysin-like protein|nr:hemolysin family protein [Syntrophales bacterium]MDY0044138.1 hemolysin family protein [Syntrophales bacterium]